MLKLQVAPSRFFFSEGEGGWSFDMAMAEEGNLRESLAGKEDQSALISRAALLFPFLNIQAGALRTPPHLRLFQQCGWGDGFLRPILSWIQTLFPPLVSLACMHLMALLVLCYFALCIGSITFKLEKEGDEWETETKTPAVGSTYALLVYYRWIVLHVLMYIMSRMLQPTPRQEIISSETVEDFPPGVLSCLTCRKWRRKRLSLSSHTPDHLLLFTAGFCAVLYFVAFLWLKLTVQDTEREREVWIAGTFQRDSILLLVGDHLSGALATVNVMGFLYRTLEQNCVQRDKHQSGMFEALVAFFVVIWASCFMTILMDRQLYTSAWVIEGLDLDLDALGTDVAGPVYVVLRVLAAFAQVFITHSSVMLLAVLLGHSEHLVRTADLEEPVFIWRILPMGFLALVLVVYLLLQKKWHVRPECAPSWFPLFVSELWPYLYSGFCIITGGLLAWLSTQARRNEVNLMEEPVEAPPNGHHGEDAPSLSPEEPRAPEPSFRLRDETWKDLDFDSFLLLLTWGLAVLYYVADMYYKHTLKVSGFPISWWVSISRLIVPFGLVAYTLAVYKHPPKKGRASFGLWVAMTVAIVNFCVFQVAEDCEITSDLPGCCTYPWFPDYNDALNLHAICNKDKRCRERNPAPYNSSIEIFCALPEEDGHDEDFRLKGTTDNATCKDLKRRWKDFIAIGPSNISAGLESVEEEEQGKSTVYKTLSTIGQSACVEFYFTTLGVLLKVIFLTQHTNSVKIMRLNKQENEHHHHGDGGDHQEVVRSTELIHVEAH